MASRKSVQTARLSQQIRAIHGTLIELVSVMNRKQRDEALIREAGVPLDRALFPLLVGIERVGPIGVVDLADRAGRDYTTVSRQVAKLESLGLVERREGRTDRRVREAAITAKGKAMTDRVDAARERIGRVILESWDPDDVDELVRLTRKLVDALKDEPREDAPPATDSERAKPSDTPRQAPAKTASRSRRARR